MFFDDDFDEFFGKKKKRKLFYDVFDEFERIEKMMDKLMEKSMKDFENIKPGKSYVYGFSMKMGPEGKPIIQEFGNFRPEENRIALRQEREPMSDFIDHGDTISVIVELPGVDEKEIQVKTEKGKLVVLVPEKYYKEIKIPNIEGPSLKWRFKNGVLEINAKKA